MWLVGLPGTNCLQFFGACSFTYVHKSLSAKYKILPNVFLICGTNRVHRLFHCSNSIIVVRRQSLQQEVLKTITLKSVSTG